MSKATSINPSIMSNLEKELKETVHAIITNPACGKTVMAVQNKYIAQAEKHFANGNPTVVAKRLARNIIKEQVARLMGDIV